MPQTVPIKGRTMRPTDFHKNAGVRLWNPETQMFLHLSGVGETKQEAYAWRGFQRQATKLRERAEAFGKDWPYRSRQVGDIEP